MVFFTPKGPYKFEFSYEEAQALKYLTNSLLFQTNNKQFYAKAIELQNSIWMELDKGGVQV